MWSALTELVRSYDAYYRVKVQQAENPEPPREGPAAWITAISTFLAAVLAGVAAYVFWGQLDEMQDEQRAWLNPNGFELSLVTINNQPAIYAQGVTENTGHSVATETIFSTKSE